MQSRRLNSKLLFWSDTLGYCSPTLRENTCHTLPHAYTCYQKGPIHTMDQMWHFYQYNLIHENFMKFPTRNNSTIFGRFSWMKFPTIIKSTLWILKQIATPPYIYKNVTSGPLHIQIIITSTWSHGWINKCMRQEIKQMTELIKEKMNKK